MFRTSVTLALSLLYTQALVVAWLALGLFVLLIRDGSLGLQAFDFVTID